MLRQIASSKLSRHPLAREGFTTHLYEWSPVRRYLSANNTCAFVVGGLSSTERTETRCLVSDVIIRTGEPLVSDSQRARMTSGELYDSRDPELLGLAHRARALLARFSSLASTDVAARAALLRELFGDAGEGVWIEPPFFCDYGPFISIGRDSFVNVNCVFLDAAPIRIGRDVLIGPGVQLLTVSHPLSAAERIVPVAERREGQSTYRNFARPIVIGDGAWLGAGTIVLPGVTIGANAVIGAGSIVTFDIPAGCLALGQPCRVQRDLSTTR